MLKIFKQYLNITDMQKIRVPQGSVFLKVDAQDDALTIWYLCDPEMPEKQRTILIYGTGHDIAGNVNDIPSYLVCYIGTVLMHEGSLVWHVFDGG